MGMTMGRIEAHDRHESAIYDRRVEHRVFENDTAINEYPYVTEVLLVGFKLKAVCRRGGIPVSSLGPRRATFPSTTGTCSFANCRTANGGNGFKSHTCYPIETSQGDDSRRCQSPSGEGRMGVERAQPILEARKINKWFGPVHALTNADLEVYPGEIVALIGDNGAGKSTLINVITGVYPPDSGEIVFEGQPVRISSPQDARKLGIETVYQDLAVTPHLDAVSNIYLGRELRLPGLLGKLGFLDNRRMRRETLGQLANLRVNIPNPERRLFTLSGGQRQGVAVARSVMWASKVVIMDEPTAALGVAQSSTVLDLMREVRNSGIPVIFISHNMPHVFAVADRIVVLRLGEVVAELDPKRDTIDDAVSLMTGSTKFAAAAAAAREGV
jgi:simple sugar transport system ATP-binding protein